MATSCGEAAPASTSNRTATWRRNPSCPPQAVDVVISPVVDLGLPLAGAFVRGRSVLPELLRRFRPHTVLASTTGGAVTYSGALSRVLRQQGSLAEASQQVEEQVPDCRLIDPEPGVAIPLLRAA